MGMCMPSGGKSDTVGSIGKMPTTGTPNTRVDMYNDEGELIQQRWYGPDGRAIWDRDWKHGGGEHEWPHDHDWDWTNEMKPDRPAYESPNGEKTNMSFC